jgi:imidazolonepropionase-like amidohydrolase
VTDLPKLAKPAERAVLAAGLDSLEKLAARSDAELLVKLGPTAGEALQAGTRIAAAALRLDNLIGTVEAGRHADLIAVNGDPTQDIRSLHDRRLVVSGGVAAHRSAALKPAADEYGANG